MRLDLRKNTIIDKRTNKCIDFWSRRNDFCIRRLINSNLQSHYAITVGRQADTNANAGFTGHQVVSSDTSGNGSVKHGYAGFTLKYQWELSEDGDIYIKVSGSGGYGTVSADFTLTPS